MKQKNLPDDIVSKSLDELKEILNNLVEKIEKNKALNQSEDDYLEIFRLNKFIEKKFQNTSKEISEKSRLKIKQILKKNGKKTK
ncbi:exonuclease VII small subunit [Candidatus Pelagibacter sp.]|nr:exonuclease VII small subunit [Candidatus Pelagibacter sp.]